MILLTIFLLCTTLVLGLSSIAPDAFQVIEKSWDRRKNK
tara:strand:+ start:575 stop:691 length:117 start_codon:yes stop_codon:yes gene_type:complete